MQEAGWAAGEQVSAHEHFPNCERVRVNVFAGVLTMFSTAGEGVSQARNPER